MAIKHGENGEASVAAMPADAPPNHSAVVPSSRSDKPDAPSHPEGGLSGPLPSPAPRPTPTGRLTTRQGVTLAMLGLVLILAGTTGAVLVALLLPPQYAARAELLFPLEAERPVGFLREDRSLTTQVALLKSRAVLAPVARANGVTVEVLDDAFDAEVVEGTEFIKVELVDSLRENGAILLDAVIAQYLSLTNGTGRAEERAYLEGEVDQARAALAASAPTPGEREAITARLVDLQSSLDDIRLSGPPARVIVGAYSDPEPVSPRMPLVALTGALTSAIVAVVVVALVARRWTRVRG